MNAEPDPLPPPETAPAALRRSSGQPRWRLRIAYHGAPFLGWQRQPNGLTVQEALEDALATILRQKTPCHGAGRTDTGVHARGQVVHFEHGGPIDVRRLDRGLNSLLPDGAAVRDIERAPDDFHARFSATWREYCYRLWVRKTPVGGPGWFPRRPFDPERLAEPLSWFLGTHDFESFSIPRNDGRHTLCTLLAAGARPYADGVEIWIRGDRFLHRMVRSLVGFCLEAAWGRIGRAEAEALLSGGTIGPRLWVPPDGLVLERVGYEGWTEPARWEPREGLETAPMPERRPGSAAREDAPR